MILRPSVIRSSLIQCRPLGPPAPPTSASIFSSIDLSRQSEWGAEEWRIYALFLDVEGHKLATQLSRIVVDLPFDLSEAKRKASRSKGLSKRKSKGLLLNFNEPGAKRGRKKDDVLESKNLARLAFEKRIELEQQEKTVTDKIALEAVCDDLGYTRSKTSTIKNNQNILNLMSNLRTHNISKR